MGGSPAFDFKQEIAPAFDVLQHLPRYGFNEGRAINVHRQYVQEGVHAKSGGGQRRERLTLQNYVSIFVGTIIDAPINRVVTHVNNYCASRDENGNRLDETIGRVLHDFARGADDFKNKRATRAILAASGAINSRFEFDTGFPRVDWVFEAKNGDTTAKTFGPVADRPSSMIGVRNVSVLSGSLVYRLANGLFHNVWDY